MATQRALVVQEPGRAVLVSDAPIPDLPDDYILVKTKAGRSVVLWLFCPLTAFQLTFPP